MQLSIQRAHLLLHVSLPLLFILLRQEGFGTQRTGCGGGSGALSLLSRVRKIHTADRRRPSVLLRADREWKEEKDRILRLCVTLPSSSRSVMLMAMCVMTGLCKRWKAVTADEVLSNSTCIVCGSNVYDIQPLLGSHVGGDACLLKKGRGCVDCSKDFGFHSRTARNAWERFKIGEIDPIQLRIVQDYWERQQRAAESCQLECRSPTAPGNVEAAEPGCSSSCR